MSKYFSKDTNFTNYPISEDGSVETSTIPEFTNENIISNENRELLSSNNSSELEKLKQQNEQLQKMINTYTTETNTNVPNQFNHFAPAELFEKLNQLIFVVSNLSNRITDMEKTINNQQNKINEKRPTTISDPAQIMAFEKEYNRNNVQAALDNIKKGKNLPMEDYIDNSVRLEEMFPEMGDEAYQAGYNALSQIKPNVTKPTEIAVGQMRGGMNGF